MVFPCWSLLRGCSFDSSFPVCPGETTGGPLARGTGGAAGWYGCHVGQRMYFWTRYRRQLATSSTLNGIYSRLHGLRLPDRLSASDRLSHFLRNVSHSLHGASLRVCVRMYRDLISTSTSTFHRPLNIEQRYRQTLQQSPHRSSACIAHCTHASWSSQWPRLFHAARPRMARPTSMALCLPLDLA